MSSAFWIEGASLSVRGGTGARTALSSTWRSAPALSPTAAAPRAAGGSPGLEPHRRGHQYPRRERGTEHLAFLGTGRTVAPGSLRPRGPISPQGSLGE